MPVWLQTESNSRVQHPALKRIHGIVVGGVPPVVVPVEADPPKQLNVAIHKSALVIEATPEPGLLPPSVIDAQKTLAREAGPHGNQREAFVANLHLVPAVLVPGKDGE